MFAESAPASNVKVTSPPPAKVKPPIAASVNNASVNVITVPGA